MEDYYQNTSSSNEHEFSVMSSNLIPAKLPKRNFLAIAGGITAIFLFVTLAGATYYISNQLSNKLGLAPNAPLSEPEAAGCNASLKGKPCGTQGGTCIQCPLGSASYICVVGGVCKWKEDPKTKKQSQVTTGELKVDKNTSLVLCDDLKVSNSCSTTTNPTGASTCSKEGVVNYCCPIGQVISNNKCIGETSAAIIILPTEEPTEIKLDNPCGTEIHGSVKCLGENKLQTCINGNWIDGTCTLKGQICPVGGKFCVTPSSTATPVVEQATVSVLDAQKLICEKEKGRWINNACVYPIAIPTQTTPTPTATCVKTDCKLGSWSDCSGASCGETGTKTRLIIPESCGGAKCTERNIIDTCQMPPCTPTPVVSTTKTCTYKTCVGSSCQLKSFTYNPFRDTCPTSTCADPEDCKPTPTATKCQNGMALVSRKCSDDEKSMIFCDSDGETSIVACNSGMYCPKSDNKCIAKPTATPVSQTGTYCTPSNAICKLGLPPTCSPCQGNCSGSFGNVYCSPTPTPTPPTPAECSSPPNIKKCNSDQKSFSWCTENGQLATLYCSNDAYCPPNGTGCLPKQTITPPTTIWQTPFFNNLFNGILNIFSSNSQPECDVGLQRCEGEVLNTCPAGKKYSVTCVYGCENNHCKPKPIISTTSATNNTIPIPTVNPFPALGTVKSTDMQTFAEVAKQVGEVIQYCQNTGNGSGSKMAKCFCDVVKDCKTNSTSSYISTELNVIIEDGNGIQCVELVSLIEQVRTSHVTDGCNANTANDLGANCHTTGYYYCNQSEVQKSGFVAGDVINWRNAAEGHTAICTETSNQDCNIIEANLENDNVVQFRQVSKTENFEGVWRKSSDPNDPSIKNCKFNNN